jgi:hypothetical protein
MPEAKARKRKMKQQRRNFRTDTEAVSEVIGMVLILAILVTFFTLIQVSVVPDWNKKVEADHIPAVYDDMTSLSSDISDSASRAIAKKSSIQLGARYPDRVIFLNPGPGAFGTLTVENDVAVNVECTDVDEGVTSRNFNTSRLIYELTGRDRYHRRITLFSMIVLLMSIYRLCAGLRLRLRHGIQSWCLYFPFPNQKQLMRL